MRARLPGLLLAITAACGGAPRTNTKPDDAVPKSRTTDADAAARPGPWLWEVRTGDAVSYVFVLPPAPAHTEEVPALVWQALDASTIFYGPYTPAGDDFSDFMLLPEDTSLEAELGETDFVRLGKQLNILMSDADVRKRVRPWVPIHMLMRPWARGDDIADDLEKRAAANKIPIEYVLDRRTAIALWDRMYGVRFLRAAMMNLNQFRETRDTAVSAYQRGDMSALRRAAHEHDEDLDDMSAARAFYADHVRLRTAALKPVLARGGAFVAIDWDDAVRKDGALEVLRADGVELKRVQSLQRPVVAIERAWNTIAECDAATKRFQAFADYQGSVDQATIRTMVAETKPGLMNVCLAWATPVYPTCMNNAKTGEDALECYRVVLYDAAKKQGGDTSGLTRETFSDTRSGRFDAFVNTMAELSAEACACSDSTCATHVSRDLFEFARASRTVGGALERMPKLKQHVKDMLRCLHANGVDKQWFLDELKAAGGF